jgi:hypothetical protein
MYKYILYFTLSFLFSYEVGDKLSYYDQLKEYDVCYGAQQHGIQDGLLSFSNFNGSNSDFHVFFIDLAASW